MGPVRIYKHYQQVRYNISKPDLDKNTEIGLKVGFSKPLSFEAKYVFLMLDRILINCWRVDNAVMLMRPWILASRKNIPTFTHIRTKFTNQSRIDDYVLNFAETYLYNLHSSHCSETVGRVIVVIHYTPKLTPNDKVVLSVIQKYRSLDKWPTKRKRLNFLIKTYILVN